MATKYLIRKTTTRKGQEFFSYFGHDIRSGFCWTSDAARIIKFDSPEEAHARIVRFHSGYTPSRNIDVVPE